MRTIHSADGACRLCGRPRSRSASGAPVSCCSRSVVAPRTAEEAESALGALTAAADRLLLAGPRARGSGLGAVIAGIVVSALVAGAAVLVSVVR